MNTPPSQYIRVPHRILQTFVLQASQAVGLPDDKAQLLAELLVANDLRGVFSHGTRQIATYARLMRDGVLNPRPEIKIIRETPSSLTLDGDGGLGYFPAYEGTLRLIEKAKQQGIAILLTRNHGHFGAAGIYARLPLSHDLITFVTSGHQLKLEPGQPYLAAAGGSPIAFSVPANQEAALVLDFGATIDLSPQAPFTAEMIRHVPGVVLRCIGLGTVCQTWGGFLAGVPLDEARAVKRFPGANQGALVITFRIDLFMSPEDFKCEMDEYVRRVKTLQPLEGFKQAYLPGGIEAEREQRYLTEGIPVGQEHQQLLQELADELHITPPWST